jgi:predicted AAA+ superfamily ATPase
MIERKYLQVVQQQLAQFSSVALLGPRQVGKTTLARTIAQQHGNNAIYLDLERAPDRRRIDDPDAFWAHHADKLIILDEIQRVPEIFVSLRGAIDERRRMGEKGGKFLLLGSASIDLLRQSSESLAGRITYIDLPPLQPDEVAANGGSIDALWLRGGFPESYLAHGDAESLLWRLDFIRTYLERDVRQFGLQVGAEPLELFWRMISNDQGELFNGQRYAKSLGVSAPTVARYLGIFENLLLFRILRPWHSNAGKRLVKSHRTYVRDAGLLHAILGLGTMADLRGHGIVGKSWEGFVIEALMAAAGSLARTWFYRSAGGAEADLVIEFGANRIWAVEIKLSSAPTVDRGFHHACDDLAAERRIVVHRGDQAYPMRGGIEAMPLKDAIAAVRIAAAH